MPARKSTGSASSSSSSARGEDRNIEYIIKRQKNNDAVKKTRQKSKKTADERKKRVEKLKTENEQLEAKIEEKKNNIQCLKDLLLSSGKSKEQLKTIEGILRELSDDDDEIG